MRPDNAQGEYYLPDAVHVLAQGGGFVQAVIAPDADEILGVNTRVELARAEAVYRRRIVEHWMLQGVTIVDPDTVYIDADVSLAPDVTVLPFTFIRGNTRIEEDCRIGPHADIADSVVERGAAVERAVVKGSRIGPGCAVGPYAYLRPGTVMEERATSAVRRSQEVSHRPRKQGAPPVVRGRRSPGPRRQPGAGTITCNWTGSTNTRPSSRTAPASANNTNLIAGAHRQGRAYRRRSSIAKDAGGRWLSSGPSNATSKAGGAAAAKARRRKRPLSAGRPAPARSPPADGPGGDKGTS